MSGGHGPIMAKPMRPDDFDDNQSYWAATAPPVEVSPPVHGEITADVAIIGGGFCGVSTAWHLARRFPQLGIVLLEAKTLGNGASGRNGGQLLNWINGTTDEDEESTRRVWDFTSHGIELVLEMARGGAVRWRRDGALECYTDVARAEKAHARVERLNRIGIPVRYVQGEELRRLVKVEGVAGAVLDPGAGVIAGLDLIRAMKPRLLAAGVRIFEHTPVERVVEGAPHELRTPNGSVRARTLVLATNAYSGLLGYFRHGIFPLHSHAMAVRMDPAAWGEANGFCDDMDRISYAAMAPDGGLVFGGGSNAAYGYRYGGRTSWAVGEREVRAMHTRLSHYFPSLRETTPEWRWSGPLGVSLSRMFSIGNRGEVYWAVGFSGHGVTLANLAGEVLCDMIAGEGDRWRRMPFYQYALPPMPPDPFRWMGYHVYTGLTGRSPRRT